MVLYLLIPLAGALGALCRWTCVRALTALGTGAPWGTLAVNLIGSFLAGLLYAPLRAHPEAARCARQRLAVSG